MVSYNFLSIFLVGRAFFFEMVLTWIKPFILIKISSMTVNIPCIVLNRLRDMLNARGANTIRGLGRSFKLFDSYNGNRKVDSQEFFVGLQENGVKVSKAEADVSSFLFLFTAFNMYLIGSNDLL